MTFSVIIPVYNSEPYLKRCLDSLLTQPYEDYELFLIDDGSTDGSFDICREYATQYAFIHALQQENSGPSIARNRGIEQAKGDYLLFIDSDDYVSADYFVVLTKAVQKTGADIIAFGRIGTQTGPLVPESRQIKGHQNILDFYAESYSTVDYNSCWNKCFRRKETVSFRFPEHTVVEEDLLFNLAALNEAQSLCSIDAPLYYYDQRDFGSVTTKYNPRKFECTVTAYEQKTAYAQKWKKPELERFYAQEYIGYLSACINNLVYPTCPLKISQKIGQIKTMFTHPVTAACLAKFSGGGMRLMMMRCLIRCRLYRVAYFIHYTVFHLKNRK